MKKIFLLFMLILFITGCINVIDYKEESGLIVSEVSVNIDSGKCIYTLKNSFNVSFINDRFIFVDDCGKYSAGDVFILTKKNSNKENKNE